MRKNIYVSDANAKTWDRAKEIFTRLSMSQIVATALDSLVNDNTLPLKTTVKKLASGVTIHCKDCPFYKPLVGTNRTDLDSGHCHANPPIFVPGGYNSYLDQIKLDKWLWPEVRETDFCQIPQRRPW